MLVSCLYWLLLHLFHSSLPSGSWSKIPAFLSRRTWCAANRCLPVDLFFACCWNQIVFHCAVLHSNVAPGCEGRWHWLWVVDWIFGGVETNYDWPSCLQSLFYGTHLFLMTLVNSWIPKDALNLCALRDRGIDAVLNCARDDCRELKLRMGTVQTLSFHRHSCLQRWSWDCLLQTTEVLAQGWFEIRRCGLKLMAGARDERGLILGMPQWGWHRAELSSKLDMASD